MASPLRSGAFRFAMLVALVFALGSGLLLAIVEASIGGYATEAVSESVASEEAILTSEGGNVVSRAMIRAIGRHAAAMPERQHRYLLTDPQGARRAGSLPASAARAGWSTMNVASDEAGENAPVALVALGRRLGDGGMLVVANDTSDLTELRHQLAFRTIAAGAAITMLALVGGYWVGTLFLRRLGSVNFAVGRIMAGRLDERLPSIGMSGEFDELSTNLNRMLGRIETLVDSVRQVSTDIAHDLRTPMTRLRQRLERIETISAGTDLEPDATAALAQTDEILGIFRALLRIGTLESAAARRPLELIDLSDVAERVVQAFRPFVEDQGNRFKVAITARAMVAADRDLIGQALTNLVENAVVHTPKGSIIRVEVRRSSEGTVLSVADNGLGIPAEERTSVVRRFYRLDASRHTAGSGLGLALVKAITVHHGALLRLGDNQPGLLAEVVFPASNQRFA